MTKHYSRLILFITLVLVVFAFTAGPERADAREQEKFRNVYRAQIVDMSNRQSGLAGSAEFIVTRWTTPAERDVLLQTLSEKGWRRVAITSPTSSKAGDRTFWLRTNVPSSLKVPMMVRWAARVPFSITATGVAAARPFSSRRVAMVCAVPTPI